MRRGKLFAFSRFFVRLKVGRWTADVPPAEGPTVYVCSHGNMAGPLVTLCWLPFPVRPWVFHVFAEKESCRKQFGEYTFSKHFGLPGPVARFLAWVVSGYVSTLVASAGAIPVYRGSVHIGTTFKESVAALQAGDSVLIFPDIDYTDSSDTIGEVYNGFLLMTASGTANRTSRCVLYLCGWIMSSGGLPRALRYSLTIRQTRRRKWSGYGRLCAGKSMTRTRRK